MSLSTDLVDDLQSLEKFGIDYCLLRNWEFLEGSEVNGDIDILIPKSQRSQAEDALREVGFKYGKGGSTRHSRYRKFYDDHGQIVLFDIAWNGTGYNGLPVVDHSVVLSDRIKRKGVWTPCHEDLFVELLFHAVLNKNGFANRKKYQQTLLQLRADIDHERVMRHAYELFGEAGHQAVEHALYGNPSAATDLKWQLILSNLTRRMSLLPILIWNLIFYWQILYPVRKFNERVNPFSRPPTIVLLGPDGSGKTTTANECRYFPTGLRAVAKT